MQEDAEPPSQAQEDIPDEETVGGAEDELMEAGGDDATPAKGKTASSRQNERLYSEEGMLNTKLRKAEKKRRKKETKSAIMEDGMNADYDFKVDYAQKKSAMDISDEARETKDDNTTVNKFDLPAGVELDNE